jgi:hypothetical protein
MAYAMNPWVLSAGFHDVLGVHRTDNHDTIAATRAKGVVRVGTITRWRVLWNTRFSFAPVTPAPEQRAACTPNLRGEWGRQAR